MKKIGICGHFGFGLNLLNGQTVKTKSIAKELMQIYGEKEIMRVDTHGGVRKLVNCFVGILGLMFKCKNIIILPAQNAVRFFVPIIVIFNKIVHRNINYVVIGGWLPTFLEKKKFLKNCLKSFEHIYVETSTMKEKLEKQGFDNITLMPNFKELDILTEQKLEYSKEIPYKVCTFSRVMEEKGIEDAIKVIKLVNEKFGKIVFILDIYGQVEEGYKERFQTLLKDVPEYINYRGTVPYDETVHILKEYYAVLFPTKFYTEGIPGTIIDAYAAGVPVIASKWESYKDVVCEEKTGIGFEFGNIEIFEQILEEIANGEKDLNKYKLNCIEFAKEFIPSSGMSVLTAHLE